MPKAWWDGADPVRLYHGTSTACLPDIRTHGLLRPPRDLDSYAWEVATTYLGHDPHRELWSRIRQSAVAPREKASAFSRTAGPDRIFAFLRPGFERAARYAGSFCVHGGEVAYCVWQVIQSELGTALAPRFQGARPCVLAVDVPRDWIESNHDLDDLSARLKSLWRDGECDAFDSFEAFVEDVGSFEVSLARDVPTTYIVATHVLDASTLKPEVTPGFAGTEESAPVFRL